MYPIKSMALKKKFTIRINPNGIINQLMVITDLSELRVKKNLKQLKDAGIIA